MNEPPSTTSPIVIESGRRFTLYYFRSRDDPMPVHVEEVSLSEDEGVPNEAAYRNSEDSYPSRDISLGPVTPKPTSIPKAGDNINHPIDLTEDGQEGARCKCKAINLGSVSDKLQTRGKTLKRKRADSLSHESDTKFPKIRKSSSLDRPYVDSCGRVRFNIGLDDFVDAQIFKSIVIRTLGEQVWDKEIRQMGK
ncbi:unnamed protein product [Clonostachys chloroleuca]|uniref:Uncharacterized protein n=1 Tax=Clonostachys chloroleuca TaxID=1926264 RepID=A0AA35Q1U2_9HYPO|nr:unnamed protein product [Clonostachys chloroleuca]